MPDSKHLIEVTSPLKQASLDSVHEKNVRHGHISTLHIWSTRRPLAACRAALIAFSMCLLVTKLPGGETVQLDLFGGMVPTAALPGRRRRR